MKRASEPPTREGCFFFLKEFPKGNKMLGSVQELWVNGGRICGLKTNNCQLIIARTVIIINKMQ